MGSSRLPEAVGQTVCFSTALLRDRVYIVKPMLPWAGWALTPPFHPCSGRSCELPGRYISVALVLRSPSAGVTRYPCPAEPGLSSFGAFRPPSAAVRPGRGNIVAQSRPIVKSPCKFFSEGIYYKKASNKINCCLQMKGKKGMSFRASISESRNLRIPLTFQVKLVRRSFDSASLRSG